MLDAPFTPPAGAATARIEVRSVTKRYPGVTALDAVTFGLAPGEIRALVGKNGAGKSTLVRVLSGAEQPDSGDVLIDGEPVELRSPKDALRYGIATVHQELSVIPAMSVAENVVLGRWPTRSGFFEVGKAVERTLAVLEELGHRLPPNIEAGRLSIADRQIVEIARALSLEARVLILDEPTSSLARTEAQRLLEVLGRLAGRGVSIVYISHRMDEIGGVADSVTVMRDGSVVDTVSVAHATTDKIIEMMVGRVAGVIAPRKRPSLEDATTVLSVRDLEVPPKLRRVSLTVRVGEVVGVAGLVGSGRTELLRTLAGDLRAESGDIRIDGAEVARPTVRRMIRAGVAFTPEDRRLEGIVPMLGVDENLAMGGWRPLSRFGLIQPKALAGMSGEIVRDLSVVTRSAHDPIEKLSGGNQQKVVIGRWLSREIKVLLMDEPTRGVDVEAKAQIYDVIRDLADSGVGVLLVSSELEELFFVCDRILVLNDGEITAELRVEDTSVADLSRLAMREINVDASRH